MDREPKDSRAKRLLVLFGTAVLLALPAYSVSCSRSPYADEYYLQVSLVESGGEWSEPNVAVAVLLCDDRQDFRAPELKTKAEIENWFRYERERFQERFTSQRMEYINVRTDDPKFRHKLLLSAESLSEETPGGRLYVVANLPTARNPEEHSASVAVGKDVEGYLIHLSPGKVSIRAAGEGQISK
jgi:hypothetical protein